MYKLHLYTIVEVNRLNRRGVAKLKIPITQRLPNREYEYLRNKQYRDVKTDDLQNKLNQRALENIPKEIRGFKHLKSEEVIENGVVVRYDYYRPIHREKASNQHLSEKSDDISVMSFQSGDTRIKYDVGNLLEGYEFSTVSGDKDILNHSNFVKTLKTVNGTFNSSGILK